MCHALHDLDSSEYNDQPLEYGEKKIWDVDHK